ncbi:MAG: hypothetical protein KDK41_05410 [Leptospiraceae bacterium]|nr:hypothetical protein [Leptospiraceae bacterium]
MKKIITICLFLTGFSLFATGLQDPTTIRFDAETNMTQEYLQVLPGGNSVNTWLESMFLPAVVTNADTGSFSLTESSYFNAYGSSALWQRHYLNGLDITNPSDPGRAFFEMPAFAIASVNYANVGNTGRFKGLHLQTAHQFDELQYAFVSHLGGSSFFGPGIFDREPAQLWGAPSDRRRFAPSHEFAGQKSIEFAGSRLSALAESIFHNKNYITLQDPEASSRHTVLLSWQRPESAIQLGVQTRNRENYGAEDGELEVNTRKYSRTAIFTSWQTAINDGTLNLGAGFAVTKLGNPDTLSQTRKIEDEINLRPWENPFSAQDFWLGGNFQKENIHYPVSLVGEKGKGFLYLQTRYEHIAKNSVQNSSALARTFNNAPVDVIVQNSDYDLSQNNLFLKALLGERDTAGRFKWSWDFGASVDARASANTLQAIPVQPVGGVSASWQFDNNSELFFSLRHEAERLTFQEDVMLNAGSGSASHYRWSDSNNDKMFSQGEAGTLQKITGGSRFDRATGLAPPVYEELSIGWQTAPQNSWSYLVQGVLRYQRNLLQVDYADDFKPSYAQALRQESITGYAWNRTDGLLGQERYKIENSQADALFLALEMQIWKKQVTSFWFMNLTGGAYLHLARTMPGNDIYRNDIGRISAETADFNAQLNSLARTDYDRGYIFKLIAGFELMQGLVWTHILRYRDGTPVAHARFIDGLNQGSVVINDSERGGGETGVGRYAFFMSWDTRLIYQGKTFSSNSEHDSNWFIALDIYNLNDFRLELKERFLAGNAYRDPVESIVPRMIRISGGIRW